MSNYQDTETEVVVASDVFASFTAGKADETARASEALRYRLRANAEETVSLFETWLDVARTGASDSVAVSDEIRSATASRRAEVLAARESLRHRVRLFTDEVLTVSDEIKETPRGQGGESVGVAEEWAGARHAVSFVEDSLRFRDHSGRAAREEVEEAVTVGDATSGRMRARERVVEAVTAFDEREAGGGSSGMLHDSMRVFDEIQDRLAAVQWVTDEAEISDTFRRDADYRSQAWTANTDNWAMSRYAPATFDSMTVIGGTLYATGPGGVYALKEADEVIEAVIRTGKLDLGQGMLVHPTSVYLEYEKDGGEAAELTVTQTQAGREESWTYPLPEEASRALTNGRFILGRGLRGRHFAFRLRYPAFRGHLNDVSIVVVPTKRRI